MTEIAGQHVKAYVLFRYDDTGLDGTMEGMMDSVVAIRSDHKIEDFSEEDRKINDIVYPEKWDTKPGTVIPIRDGDDLICRLKKAGYDAFYMDYTVVELANEADKNGDVEEEEDW